MAISIRFTHDQLSTEQYKSLFQWDVDVFQASELDLVWQSKTAHLLLYDSTRLVSHVGLLKHQVIVDSETLLVGGIGGVVTLPGEQGKGYASVLLQSACDKLAQWQVDAGMLFCQEQMLAFYAHRGWTLIDAPVTVCQPENVVALPVNAMMKPVRILRWPPGAVHVPGYPW